MPLDDWDIDIPRQAPGARPEKTSKKRSPDEEEAPARLRRTAASYFRLCILAQIICLEEEKSMHAAVRGNRKRRTSDEARPGNDARRRHQSEETKHVQQNRPDTQQYQKHVYQFRVIHV
jgi:hypothetical protein